MKRLLVMMLIVASSIFSMELKEDSKLVKGQLENGLKYYIYPNQKPSNKLSVRLKVETGSLYEKEGEEGVAHFLEHMAFNGTEKYPENDLIRILESMGVGFGHDLNAYTSFEETVYMLDGQSKDLETFLDIIHQWAFKITFEEEEVEKEKGVVKEEWRRSTGLNKEKNDFYQKYLFANTLYKERLPIGKMESVEAFTKEIVEGYYDRWYVPNNMSLFVAGDIEDIAKVEAMIEELYSPEEMKELEDVEEYKMRMFQDVVITDKFVNEQLKSNSLSHIKIFEIPEKQEQKAEIRDDLINTIFNIAYRNRYSIKLNNLETNLNGTNLGAYEFNDYFGFVEYSLGLKDGRELDGITEGYAEFRQVKNGFLDVEIEEAKEAIRIYYENLLKEVDNIETSQILATMVDTDFEEEVMLTYEDELLIGLAQLETIDNDDINNFIHEIFIGSEDYSLYVGYSDFSLAQIEEAKIKGLAIDLGSYTRAEGNGEIITKEITPGTIVGEEYNEELDYYLLTLSNGSKVYVKDIDYEKNTIQFTALSRGGSGYISDEDMVALNFVSTIFESAPGTMTKEEYDRYMLNKNFSLSYGIYDDTEAFYGSSSKDEIHDLMMNYYAFMTEAKIDETQFAIAQANTIEAIKNRDNVKASEFWKEYNNILNEYDPRMARLEIEDVEKVEAERVIGVYNDRLANGIDYDYYIVGDLDIEELKASIELYLASLTTGVEEDYNYVARPTLKHNVKYARDLGHGEEATVVMYFGDNVEIDENFEYYSSMAKAALDAELIKVVREQLGGAYSISSWVEVNKHNLNRGRWGLYFTCNPERVDELVLAAEEVAKSVIAGNISDETIAYIKESYRADYERTLDTNDFYLNYFDRMILGDSEQLTPEEYNELVSKENIVEFIRSVHGGYKGVFVLNPEKKSI